MIQNVNSFDIFAIHETQLFLIIINKMYGVSEELMQRMQRRIKEKIYREMLEEEQKYKRKSKENKPSRQVPQNRYKTQPNNNDSDNQPNKYENHASPFLKESSTFLPVIAPKRKNFESDQENGKSNNPEYQGYVNRRQRRLNRQQKPTERRRASTSAAFQQQKPLNSKVEDSEDEKTEQYLSQCEQIIGNLRQLTRKNKEKMSQRQNKYDSEKEYNYSPKNKSFRGDITKDSPYKLNSYTPKTNQSSILNSSLSNPLKNSELSNNSWQNSPRPMNYSFNNEFNDSNSFDYMEKERANTRKISPPRIRIQDLKKKAAPPKENNEFIAPKQKARQNSRRLSPLRNSEDSKKQESKIKQENQQIEEQNEEQNNEEGEEGEEEPKSKGSSAKESKNELVKQNKRQKAIVKYLKKARLRGNILYQKVQSRKGQSNNDPNANPNADPNANPNADPNADPNAKPANTDPNANPSGSNQTGNNGASQANSKQLGNKK